MPVPSCSKRNVLVPIHLQRPSTAGVTCTGTSSVSSCPNVAKPTMGWSNVTLMKGATSTGPSGWWRTTPGGPSATSGGGASPVGPNGWSSVSPTRGRGRLSGGRLNATRSSSASSNGVRRSTMSATASSSSASPATSAAGVASLSPLARPAVSRTVNGPSSSPPVPPPVSSPVLPVEPAEPDAGTSPSPPPEHATTTMARHSTTPVAFTNPSRCRVAIAPSPPPNSAPSDDAAHRSGSRRFGSARFPPRALPGARLDPHRHRRRGLREPPQGDGLGGSRELHAELPVPQRRLHPERAAAACLGGDGVVGHRRQRVELSRSRSGRLDRRRQWVPGPVPPHLEVPGALPPSGGRRGRTAW